jgi:hypothetical protein
LCKAFNESNIPLNKVNHSSDIYFLQEYTAYNPSEESTLRKKFLPLVYEEKISQIREKIVSKKILISIDETNDKKGRYIANVILLERSKNIQNHIL